MKIIEFEQIDSTNNYCKQLNEKEAIVIADSQSGGRGTKGRSFVSDFGGIYISLLKTYENFDFANAFKIMINSSVAVCKTLEEFGIKPTIKWANDVLVGGKKICGTLIENTFSGNNTCRSIVGIGLNVNNTLSDDLKDIATTMCSSAGKQFDISKVKQVLIANLQKEYDILQYKSYINWFNSQVKLNLNGDLVSAVALDVADDGRLICNIGGKKVLVSSGEVSLRL
jgi:BirA family biotin operon repressor/biotin-[acetyl-CoA-carboxylase] ligase